MVKHPGDTGGEEGERKRGRSGGLKRKQTGLTEVERQQRLLEDETAWGLFWLTHNVTLDMQIFWCGKLRETNVLRLKPLLQNKNKERISSVGSRED